MERDVGSRQTWSCWSASLHPRRGVLRQLSCVLQRELSFDLFAVILDSFNTQVEFSGDFLGFLPSPDQLEDLKLAVAQTLDR